jgi:hypothetical protein
MVKLIRHKIAPEMTMEPLGEGFSVGEGSNHFQQFYGSLFKLRRYYFPASLFPEKRLDRVHILSPPAAVELKQLVVDKEAGLGEEMHKAVQDKPKGILVVRQEKRRQKGKGMAAGDAQEAADGEPQPLF